MNRCYSFNKKLSAAEDLVSGENELGFQSVAWSLY